MSTDPPKTTEAPQEQPVHELPKTDLERYGIQLFQRYQQVMDEYGNKIYMWLILVTLLVAALIYYFRTNSATNSAAWQELVQARSSKQYSEVANTFGDGTVSDWARLRESEGYLDEAINMMFTHRSEGVKKLADAKKILRQLVEKKSDSEIIQVRAQFALARALETESGKDLSAPIAAYQKVIDNFPETVQADLAEKRIEALKRASTGEFYAWFQKQEPKPEDRAEPQDGGSVPDAPAFNELGMGTTPLDSMPPGDTSPEPQGPKLIDGSAAPPFPVAPPKTGETESPDNAENTQEKTTDAKTQNSDTQPFPADGAEPETDSSDESSADDGNAQTSPES